MAIFLSRFVRCATVLFLLLILVSLGAIREPHWLTAKAVQCPPITITPAKLADGTTGVSYSQNVNATGGGGRYSFVITASSLPPGLGINASSGVISGIPTTTGSFSFLLRVTDVGTGCFATRAYTVDVNCGPISFYPPALPGAVAGTPYSQTIGGSGGRSPYVFSVSSGSLPTGLSLDSSSGRISGTPTGNAIWIFDISVTDANPCTSTRRYGIEVTCPVLTVNPASLPSGTVGVAYNQTFSTIGGSGPYSYGTLASALPPGLSLTTAGTLSGTPTTPGTYSFAVRSNGSNGCFGERSYTVVINRACPAITVNPASLPVGQVGLFYSSTFTTTGGVAPFSFRISEIRLVMEILPAGLSLDLDGNLTGTPTTPASSSFTVRAIDANGCIGERHYSLTISAATCATISLDPPTLPSGVNGASYNQTINATGGVAPYSFGISAGALPNGLSLTANGSVTGSPTVSGSFSFTVKATDANGCTGERSYSLLINNAACPTVSLSPTSLPPGTNGSPYSQAITATGGTGPYSFSISNGTLPTGLTLASNGNLTGSLAITGNFSFTVRATDSNLCNGEGSYSLAIAPSLVTSVSAASFAPSGPLAPESIVAAFGLNLAPNTEAALTQPLPTLLAGVSLKIRDSAGIERLAPLYFVSSRQVNYQVPAGTSLGSATLTILNEGGLTNASAMGAGSIDVEPVSPGLFSADARGKRSCCCSGIPR